MANAQKKHIFEYEKIKKKNLQKSKNVLQKKFLSNLVIKQVNLLIFKTML